VARFRIKIGKEISSAALVADGHHARVDGLTSLSVLFGAVGVWLGFPLADPIVGLFITAAIFWVLWESAKSVLIRFLDGVDPEIIEKIRDAVNNTEGVEEITKIKVRWVGHRLHAELNITVDATHTVEKAHGIAKNVQHQLIHHLSDLSNATIHVDPANASGDDYHPAAE
jgi:cation diffusion facilitator family transporter